MLDYNSVALIVSAEELDSHDVHTLKDLLHASGLKSETISNTEVLTRINTEGSLGPEPSVIIFGPGLPNAVSLARSIRKTWSLSQLLFIPNQKLYQKMKQDLSHAPMIGPNWSLIEIDSPNLAKNIERAIEFSKRRVRLRTTLDKANIRLSVPKAIDGLKYRKTVISEHYLASLLQQSSDAVICLDPQNHVMYWSRSAERIFGINQDAILEKPAEFLPFWSKTLEAKLAEIHSGNVNSRVDLNYKSGLDELWLEISFSNVQDDNKTFLGTSLVIRDITDRTRLLQIEQSARQEAEAMIKMKDEFLATLSHELRTPLSAVLGRSQLLQLQHQDNPKLLSSLKVIERNALLQAKLIDDLLDVSTIIAGKLKLDYQEVQLEKLISSVIDSLHNAAEQKKIHLSQTGTIPIITIWGDFNRLQQVFTNLLTNAIKFTPEGGSVQVYSRINGAEIDITVEDNGFGIADDFLPKIFQKFRQEDASTTRKQGGLGLGLSIVKQLVELHGGAIKAKSQGRNLGSSFTITLPIFSNQLHLDNEMPNERGGRSSSDGNLLKGYSILIAEDFDDTRILVEEVLQAQGATVIAVDSAASALAVLEHHLPDVLVSDIGMPNMDGYELIQKIRVKKIPEKALPAIALTAFASPTDREKALSLGFQEHIAKPLIVTKLVSAILKLKPRIT